jgi:hypothetical protein
LLQALVKPVFELAGPVTNSIDKVDIRTHNHATVQRGLGAVAAVFTWLAWLAICPALGFPSLGSAAMVNRAIFPINPEAGHNPDFWVGWVIVIAGLVLAIAAYFVFEGPHLVPTGVPMGVIYGVALWLFTGVVIMGLLGFIEPPRRLPANLDPMHATLMMHSLGPLAALAALIAWVLFGAILAATGRAQR